MSYFNIDLYEPVENRIQAFWKKFPDGRIITDLQRTERTDGRVEWVCRTEAFTNREDGRPQATGFATEIEGSSVINIRFGMTNVLKPIGEHPLPITQKLVM